MKEEGIQIFKLISRIEFELGFISIMDYYYRLVTLYHLTDKSEEIRKYLIRIFGEANISESYYLDEQDYDTNDRQSKESRNKNGDDQESTDPTLHFITPKTGKISKWEFIKGDPDFFPSIPHGHAIINESIKLDSYQGYYYNVTNSNDKPKSTGRESRKYMIELWNNDKFRIFAIDQIDWYLQTYPSFTWRVPRNRIRCIPKKR